MDVGRDTDKRSLIASITYVVVAVALTSGAAVSLIRAADGANSLLDDLKETGRACSGASVGSVGDGWVLGVAALVVVLVGATGWAMFRLRPWGRATAKGAMLPLGVLWLFGYGLGESSFGCDSAGLYGALGDDLNRAGWLLIFCVVVCGLASAWLSSHTDSRRRRSIVWDGPHF
ncbi:MAG TPA: hypothetical protein VFA78_07515 [Chloroflexota bacterium]|nr:hypothetical protein [Chloroflexota bacterium]